MSHEFDILAFRFAEIQKRFQEAGTHDEKVELAKIAREIAKEARKKLDESKRRELRPGID